MKPISAGQLIISAVGLCAAAQTGRADSAALYRDKASPVEARVEDLLPRLTLEEKLSIIGGLREFYIMGIPRLGIPEIRTSDGPLGVRQYGRSTAYPATIGLAATWDTQLARQFGAAMGSDARARAVHILLGPAVNINRVPQNGRNFEYLSEDPFLAAAFATQIVSGIQAQGVVSTVKHFAANNQETERGTIDARVSERALEEIYFPAFRAAVEKGHAWAVMSAYNRLNGTYCTANDWLNNKILKGDWGFKGMLMSDWGATHDSLGAANGGLDLEMPGGEFMNPEKLGPLIKSGKVSLATIDDKVRRILRLEIANGFLDRPQALDSTPKDDPRSDAVALQVARESIVLLKNERNALPINMKKVKRIVVIGPNSAVMPAGGGSSHVEPFHYVSVIDGLRAVAGPKVKIESVPAPGPELLASLVARAGYAGPLKLEFLAGEGRNPRVIATLSDSRIDHNWRGEPPAPGVDPSKYWARWTGTIRAPSTGAFIFMVQNHGNVTVKLDGKQIIFNWFNTSDTLYTEAQLEAGKTYPVEVEVHYDSQGSPGVRFAWGAAPALLTDADERLIRSADAVIVCAGFNLMLEGEGSDRSYELPESQRELIRRAAALNPRTIVVMNSGGVVATADWLDSVPALLQAWYPGQEGGHAIAEILFGAQNPSGKLPITYEKRKEDSPSFGNFPGSNGKVEYAEGILVGYRWFDRKSVAPLFPFGFGLSYTTFQYANLRVEPADAGHFAVSFDVTNNGTRSGGEVSQVYVSPPVSSSVFRAVRELKGFSRVNLATDQTANVTVVIDRSAFAYYDEAKHDWVVEPGSYTVTVGSSSRNLTLSHSIDVQ